MYCNLCNGFPICVRALFYFKTKLPFDFGLVQFVWFSSICLYFQAKCLIKCCKGNEHWMRTTFRNDQTLILIELRVLPLVFNDIWHEIPITCSAPRVAKILRWDGHGVKVNPRCPRLDTIKVIALAKENRKTLHTASYKISMAIMCNYRHESYLFLQGCQISLPSNKIYWFVN